MPRDYEIKLNRSTMTVTISSGLSKKSSKISSRFYYYLMIFFAGPNQANAEKPRGLQFKPQNACVDEIPLIVFG
jgi:hypothetical protein